MNLVSINSNSNTNNLLISREIPVNHKEIMILSKEGIIKKMKDMIYKKFYIPKKMKKQIIIIRCLPLRSQNILLNNHSAMLIITTINLEHNSNQNSNLSNFKSNYSCRCFHQSINMIVLNHLTNQNSVFGIKWYRKYMNFQNQLYQIIMIQRIKVI